MSRQDTRARLLDDYRRIIEPHVAKLGGALVACGAGSVGFAVCRGGGGSVGVGGSRARGVRPSLVLVHSTPSCTACRSVCACHDLGW